MSTKRIEEQVARKKRRMNKAIKLLKTARFTPLTARTFADALTYYSDNHSSSENEELLGIFKYILKEME